MKFILPILLLINQISLAQNEIQFNDSSLSQALMHSKQHGKPVLLVCYASWCTHCNKMKQEVFTDSAVAVFYNNNFICIKQDMEAGDGIAMHLKFAVKSFPTFIFLDSNATTLYRMSGEYRPSDFIEQGKNALTKEKQLPYLKAEFEADVSNPQKCYAYLMGLRRGEMDFSSMSKKYFATKADSQLLNEINWKLIANGITDINSHQFQFVLQHRSEYEKIASPARVQRKLLFITYDLLMPMVEKKDTIKYFNNRPAAAAMHDFKVDSLLFTLDKMIYEKTENWEGYKTVSLQSARTYSWNDYHELQEMADNFLQHIDDASASAEAAQWARRSVELNPQYSNYVLGAKLFLKAGDKTSAQQMAQQGKDLAAKSGRGTPEADELLQKVQ